MSDSLWLHGLQHDRLPCPYNLPELAQTHVHWISDAIHPFHPLSSLLLLPSIFPSIRSFSNVSALRIRCQIIRASVASSVLQVNIQGWFPLEVTGLTSLWSKGLSRVFFNTTVQIHQFFGIQTAVQLSHPYMTTGKTVALTRRTSIGKVISLLFNMLFRFVTAFLSRSKRLLISWLQSPSAVILEPKKIKSLTVSIVSPSICHEVMGLDAMILVFWILSYKPAFSLFLFTFIETL